MTMTTMKNAATALTAARAAGAEWLSAVAAYAEADDKVSFTLHDPRGGSRLFAASNAAHMELDAARAAWREDRGM